MQNTHRALESKHKRTLMFHFDSQKHNFFFFFSFLLLRNTTRFSNTSQSTEDTKANNADTKPSHLSCGCKKIAKVPKLIFVQKEKSANIFFSFDFSTSRLFGFGCGLQNSCTPSWCLLMPSSDLGKYVWLVVENFVKILFGQSPPSRSRR